MSAIIGFIHNDRVYLATNPVKDLLGVRFPVSKEINYRIHKVGKDILVGVIGKASQAQNLYLRESWFVPKKGEKFDKKFIVTSVVTKFLNILREKRLLEEDDDGNPMTSTEFLVAKGADLYYIGDKFEVHKVNTLDACSDGSEYRYIGNYMKLKLLDGEIDDVDAMLCDAFEKCAKRMNGVIDEVVVVDTASMKFRKYGGQK